MVRKRSWFKAGAATVAALTLWFGLDGPAQAAVAAQERERNRRGEEMARRVGIQPERESPAAEARRIAQKRAESLATLARLTAPERQALAAAKEKARAIEAAHLPDLLAGTARAAEETSRAARRLDAAKTAQERQAAGQALTAAGAALTHGAATAEQKGDRSQIARLGGALAKAKQLGKAAAKGEHASAREVIAAAPQKRKGIDTSHRRPTLSVPLTPPKPRSGLRLGMSLPDDLRQFYGSILDAKGLEVETGLGLADPAMLAAGFLPGARVASLDGLADVGGGLLNLAEGALGAPQPDDLAVTSDTRVTPAMRQTVTDAGGSVIALFNWVHDRFEAEPYYGSKKGSVGAFEEKGGNDADLSNLLVALLRAAGVPARYEYGTVDLTPDQAMAWAGTTDPGVAADVLYSTGVPATRIVEGAKVVAVRVEHVWVRAHVPYSNYRGVPRAGSRAMWVRLDPTLKRAKLKPAVDLRGKVAFDYARFLSKVSGATPLELFEQQLRGWIAANGIGCKSLDDAIPTRELVPDGLSVLPAELPAPIVTSLASFSTLPSMMRHTATIGVGEWSVPIDLPAIYGSVLTIRYRGASSQDAAAIAASGSISRLATPAAVQVVPTLTEDGTEVGRGAAVLPGTDQELDVSVTVPHGGTSLIRHHVAAGSVFAVGFPVGTVPDSVVAAREADLQAAVLNGTSGDDLEAARGNRALWRYFWHLDREEPRLFALQWMRVGRDVSEGIAGREVGADLLYGTPVRVKPGNFYIDAPRYSIRPYGVDGNQTLVKTVAELAGYHGSTREHLIWEETVNVPAISTVRILQVSRQQGLQILSIDGANVGLVASLPYSEEARTDITNAIHAGLVAQVPERPVTWGSYVNATGYVLEDPMTGAADFRISGAFSGGSASGDSSAQGVSCPVCSGPNAPSSSTVGLSLGNMFFSETDLSLPARGIPISFTRRYDSMSPYGGRLGPGWQHTYELKIVADADGSAIFVNDVFQAERFQLQPDGSYATPAGYHEALQRMQDGWLLTFKDGRQYRFQADGQLQAIQDTNGHLVISRYDAAGRLATVTDSGARVALTFEYDATGSLSAVTDLFGRSVIFGHQGGDLTSATDVLGAVQSYAYDGAHRLVGKTDKNGKTTLELYDGEGRWIGSQEGDGTGRAASYDFLNRRAVHTDKRGSQTIYEYNESGNPTAVTDALGNRRVLEWDQTDDKLSETDARGNRTGMTYDGAGNLLTRTDAVGATSVYTHDGQGRVLTVSDAAGNVTSNVYDTQGNLLTSTDAMGATTAYEYTADGLPQTIRQPGGAATSLLYKTDGSVGAITDAAGGTTSLGYDANGHLATITDALGNARSLAADAAGHVTSMTDAAGGTTQFTYDPQGNRTTVVDPGGNRTSFAYDTAGRLVEVTDAKGNVTRTEYDPEGHVTARVDAKGGRVTWAYDAVGRLVTTTDAAGKVTTQGYCADVSGQPCGVVDALGNLTQVSFDALGRVTTTVDANGVVTRQHYDVLGRRDASVDGAGRTTSYGYDAAGRLQTVTDPAGGVTRYGYDARGNRTSVTDANGHVTSFTYDLSNRLLSETNPIGKTTSYEYDLAGNRRYKTDGNGQRTEYVYDANRRLMRVAFADGKVNDFGYDARGNRTLEKSAAHERGLHYDALGRLDHVEDRTLGRTLDYGYDVNGNRSWMAVDTGETVGYRWDAVGRLSQVTDPQGAATTYRYDAAGRRSGVTYGNGTRATYAYDATGQVLSVAYADPTGAVETAFGYGYDASGNRQYKRFADGTEEPYGYDALSRLTGADYPGGRHVEYGYDAVGNRVSQVDTGRAPVTQWATSATASDASYSPKYATGAPDGYSWMTSKATGWLETTHPGGRARSVRVHEAGGAPLVTRVDLTDDAGTAHTVYSGGDQTGNGGWLVVPVALTEYRVVKVKVWVAQGGGQSAGYIAVDAVGLDVQATDTYQYNGFNQLLSVTGTDGTSASFGYDGNGNETRKTETSGSGTVSTTTYAYDGDNRLVGIALPTGLTNAFEYDANGLRTKKTDSSGTTRYLLDGLSVIAQYGTDGTKQAWYTQSLARIDEVLSVVNESGKFWYQSDALGSVYGLSNQSGVLVGNQDYDVFGAPVPALSGPMGQPFGFTGREHELDSGLVYARARYLQPGVGRWSAADPLGMIEGPNRFAYVRSNPALDGDPMGLFSAGLHDDIIRAALEPTGASADDIATLKSASREADAVKYQGSEVAYRHGMRPPGQDLATGIGLWANFVSTELATAAEISTLECDNAGKTVFAKYALLHLGFGMHAVMDAYSPYHRFQTWSFPSQTGVYHVEHEPELTRTSPGVQDAIGASARYWRAFVQMRPLVRAGGDPLAWAILLFGYEAYLDAQWLATEDPPGW